MGLDHELRRQYIKPKPEDMNERIIVELEDQEDEEMEEVFNWRKVYPLHEYFCRLTEMSDEDNGTKGKKLTKEDLEDFMIWLEQNNGETDDGFGGVLDFTKEISQLKDILEHDDFDNFQYFYWAWW